MLASSIGWILIISGIGTAAGGLAGLFLPRTTLQLMFGVKSSDGVTTFFVRHWGALLFVVCALTVYSAYVPVSRAPILTASIIEKLAIVALIFFGPLQANTRDDGYRDHGRSFGHPVHCLSCGILVPCGCKLIHYPKRQSKYTWRSASPVPLKPAHSCGDKLLFLHRDGRI
jgi:hypothetical protein